jgi:hypothetical protein
VTIFHGFHPWLHSVAPGGGEKGGLGTFGMSWGRRRTLTLPSPGVPGEGKRGDEKGDHLLRVSPVATIGRPRWGREGRIGHTRYVVGKEADPHPGPLPAYREREREGEGVEEKGDRFPRVSPVATFGRPRWGREGADWAHPVCRGEGDRPSH